MAAQLRLVGSMPTTKSSRRGIFRRVWERVWHGPKTPKGLHIRKFQRIESLLANSIYNPGPGHDLHHREFEKTAQNALDELARLAVHPTYMPYFVELLHSKDAASYYSLRIGRALQHGPMDGVDLSPYIPPLRSILHTVGSRSSDYYADDIFAGKKMMDQEALIVASLLARIVVSNDAVRLQALAALVEGLTEHNTIVQDRVFVEMVRAVRQLDPARCDGLAIRELVERLFFDEELDARRDAYFTLKHIVENGPGVLHQILQNALRARVSITQLGMVVPITASSAYGKKRTEEDFIRGGGFVAYSTSHDPEML